jgi:hypothetical protein
MNRDCKGDFYELDRMRFYRCFADGSVHRASVVGATCPNCRRPIDSIDRGKVKGVRRTRIYVQIPNLGWIVHSGDEPL